MTRPFIVNFLAVAVMAAVFVWAMGFAPARAATCVIASWYGSESGNRTADGTPFDGSQMVAAHRTMKFGTKLLVRYRGGPPVLVTVRDRGPFIRGRKLDLSRAAAAKLGMIHAGVAKVCYEVVK